MDINYYIYYFFFEIHHHNKYKLPRYLNRQEYSKLKIYKYIIFGLEKKS